MGQISINIAPGDFATLTSNGFKLPGLANTQQISEASWFEGPTSVLAKVTHGAELRVGAFCNLSGGTLNNVHFGRYCSIASGVVIGSHEHPTDWLTTSRTAYYPQVNGWDTRMATDPAQIHKLKRPFAASCPITTIEPDVWIGQGAFIKAGVTIGAGAIIGARATVVKDVPPYAIVVGTPGRVLRHRFADPVIERFLDVKWWQYSIYDLFDAPMDDIERALDVIESKVSEGQIAPYIGPEITASDLAAPEKALAEQVAHPVSQAS